MSEERLQITDAMLEDIAVLRPAIHRDLCRMAARRLGYDFLTGERLERVMASSMAIMDFGLPFPYAFAEAVSDEMILYGDPRGGTEPVGIMR